MRNYNGEIARILFDAQFQDDGERLRAFEKLVAEIYEEGWDKAAQEITLKIQSCIPVESRTVEQARIKGAWTDAGNIALNHLGKLSNPNYPE